METAKSADKIEMLSILNENIALLYASQKDYDQALTYFKTVKKLNEKINNERGSAISQSNMADVYADAKNIEYAMYNINASISVFEKNEILDWLAFAYQVKGKTYLIQKKYEWALFWYNQSKALYDKKVDDERAEIDLLHGLAEANLGIGNDSLSEKHAIRGFNLSQQLSVKEGTKKLSKTLYQIHKQNEAYINALAYHELYQELSDTIAKNESKKSLVMLKTKINHEQQKENLITENQKALGKQKNYIYASLAILLVLLSITVLVRRNEGIQKKLNKELNSKKNDLEKQEIELRGINQAKDKLFSIIGHDLRGPIGALQGLLQLFEGGEIKRKEFLNFVPKLRTDIGHISFTLNNLLSWGQSQMNGTITKPTRVSLENLVNENMNLLSETAEGKSIKMINLVPDNTFTWSDADQLDIVIRNLMSNAIKFTPHDGAITIGAKEMDEFWEISVTDTGIGMDQETQSKIFDVNNNITTYGTNNEKGTGLGLSLCKEMVENNNGMIWVESILNEGTSFYFTVPKTKDEYEQAS
jgi:signal transduction histidine kinase